ncbi:DNA repair protein RecN [Legionella pneumophila]|uniref:DNA repair protein RecN n=1 Tax=Legionella pneumophila subsp. pascullei TaxID=91890 RepID=A0AAX2IZ77_LEGPN|nr:DNA repair protein RecN [Legionella pneumophila]AMP90760.1 DNA repair protein RecN [Legionella pneumophila subsp. pascullei]AMP93744.1 DNA repair protein RecN [Legionella pneumophila subsp. pascullei]AMP96661.1 DNA repair protein RecN [Legionella pneumophila subsp. pascullei]SQG91707.1 DNA repair ATPase [Legionella pneumophila subsp. pascullei]VEH08253.1 DNA repair ATPase [Legionella pneumophila subsp. pascullei]
MLTTLRIEHFAIVKQLELDFAQGMTTFTGETGAGKSIMIDALLLVLGEKADPSVVRPGEEKCDITAGFCFDESSEPAQWLAEHDISCQDGEIYLRRIIYPEGRSKSYINGQPFPLQKIKELSEKLVHIHGQHQHQTLMQHATHRQQLDRYANNHLLLNEVNALYKQHQQIVQEINTLQSQEQQVDRIKLLQFQIDELQALGIQEGELEALHQEHQILHHAREYLQLSQQINELLNSDDQPNICSGLNQIFQLIQQLPQEQPQIKSTAELINSALIQCEEAISEMQEFADKIQLDPERLQEVESRISSIHQLARKYHLDSKSLQNHEKTLQNELENLQNVESKLAHLHLQLAQINKAYENAALKLSESRKIHAEKLAQEITASIQQLGMPKGWIEIEITPLEKMQVHGLDKVEYKVCTNPGMAPDSLSKIASGGELSRISLAIQMITAQQGSTPTLLFDEVDVGIGGSTAALVGKMLRNLGERLQVFCVTHQPQVAASAHHHFLVTKNSNNNQTFTNISLLEAPAKVAEIARMLGGLTITEQTLSHAKELISLSNE